MANDLALNRKDHGLQFATKIDPNSGETVYELMLINNAEGVAQRIKIALLTFLGEWFLDLSYGLPYFESVLVKNPNASLVHSIFRDAILRVEGVTLVNSLSLDFDRPARILTVNFVAETSYNQNVKDKIALDFKRKV